jgi:hypothetical protein
VDVEAQAENGPVEVGGEVEATSETTVRKEKGIEGRCQRTAVLYVWWDEEVLQTVFSSRCEHTITRFGLARHSQ